MATLEEALSKAEDPNYRHIVSISGGKDSAALAIYLYQNYPRLPVEYVFCDTGCELPETEEYLCTLQALLGKEIRRVTVFDVLNIPQKLERSPFDYILREYYSGFLPSPRSRWCTRMLKIKPFEHFVGKGNAFCYIGIRGDEDREGFSSYKKPPAISEKPNIIPVYPFRDNRIGYSDVKRILEDSGVGWPEYYEWRSRSGCYFCFYQMIGEWQGLHKRHPDLFERAKHYESRAFLEEIKGRENVRDDETFTWLDGRSLDEVSSLPPRSVPSMDETEGCAICHL